MSKVTQADKERKSNFDGDAQMRQLEGTRCDLVMKQEQKTLHGGGAASQSGKSCARGGELETQLVGLGVGFKVHKPFGTGRAPLTRLTKVGGLQVQLGPEPSRLNHIRNSLGGQEGRGRNRGVGRLLPYARKRRGRTRDRRTGRGTNSRDTKLRRDWGL